MSIYNFQYFYENDNGRRLSMINDLSSYLEDKLFISVGGGIGAGKSYFINKILNKIVGDMPVMDVDEYTAQLSGGKYNREMSGKARAPFRADLDKMLHGDKSFIYTGTNANLKGTADKLQTAKDNEFTTVLIHIDIPLELALQQSQKRAEAGERNQIPEEVIERTIRDSKSTFEQLKNNKEIVDFYFTYKK